MKVRSLTYLTQLEEELLLLTNKLQSRTVLTLKNVFFFGFVF